jgi:hypothetical protein
MSFEQELMRRLLSLADQVVDGAEDENDPVESALVDQVRRERDQVTARLPTMAAVPSSDPELAKAVNDLAGTSLKVERFYASQGRPLAGQAWPVVQAAAPPGPTAMPTVLPTAQHQSAAPPPPPMVYDTWTGGRSGPRLPSPGSSLLVRTDYSDEALWQEVSSAARQENDEGFQAWVEPVGDPALDGTAWEELRAHVPPNQNGICVLFVVDEVTIGSPDHPVLVVDLYEPPRPPFRCVPSELWAVENNLNLGDMDWEDFAGSIDETGVYRGL